MDIHGGTFTGGTGGFGIDVFIGNITLYGTFTVNGMADFTGSIPTGQGTITGFFDDSTTEETFTYRQLGEGGTLTVVPEPAEWMGGGLLAGCVVVWIVRRVSARRGDGAPWPRSDLRCASAPRASTFRGAGRCAVCPTDRALF